MIYSTLSNDGWLRMRVVECTLLAYHFKQTVQIFRSSFLVKVSAQGALQRGPAQLGVACPLWVYSTPQAYSSQGTPRKICGGGSQLQLHYLLLSLDMTGFKLFFNILCRENGVFMRY